MADPKDVPKLKLTPAEEAAMFDRLRGAYGRKIITVFTDPYSLNTVGSPVFDPWENTLALLASVIVALFVMIGVGLLAGVIALVVGVIIYVAILRPMITERVRQRAINAMLRSPKALDVLWKFGGVAITRTDHNSIGAMAPDADWRLFVRRHLPDVTMAEHLGDEFKGPRPRADRRSANRGGTRRADDRK